MTTQTLILTTQEWQDRIKTNAVFRSMRAVNELAAQIVDGRRNSAIVSGPAGVGKTWAFEEAFKANRIKFHQPRVSSPQALIEALWLDPKGTFLFDECDAMLSDVALLNVLKIATDTKLGPRILEWKTRKEESTIDPFRFEGRIVFLMNSDLHKVATGRLGPHISALMDRCEPYIMTFDHFAIWEYTCYLAICERMLMRENINREITNQALRFFTETMWRRNSVSPRALTLIARSMKNSPDLWPELLEPTLLREPFSDAPIPPIPQIMAPPPKSLEPETPEQRAKRLAKKKARKARKKAREAEQRAQVEQQARIEPAPVSRTYKVTPVEDTPPKTRKAKETDPVKKLADAVEKRAKVAAKPMSKAKAEMNAPVLLPFSVDWSSQFGDLPLGQPKTRSEVTRSETRSDDDLEDAEPASHVLQ